MERATDDSVFEQVSTAEARDMHDIAERLRQCGVGKKIEFPHIMVVGKPSSGKSAVLRALAGIAFPESDKVRSRFPVELVFRRGAEEQVDVSVHFEERAPAELARGLSFGEFNLTRLIEEAERLMGLGDKTKFSADLLRLDIQGPEMQPMVLVDLPGYLPWHHGETEETEQKRELVDRLIQDYARKPSSIMFVVTEANDKGGAYTALSKTKPYDQAARRTIGIITKPDLASADSPDENDLTELAENKHENLSLPLGWFLLFNRQQKDDEDSLPESASDDQGIDDLSVWSLFPRNRRGVASLRRKLNRVLYDQMRNTLEALIREIKSKLDKLERDLHQMDRSNRTIGQMRNSLTDFTTDFQRLVRDALHGRYSDDFFHSFDERRLRARLCAFHRVFHFVMVSRGSKRVIGFESSDKGEAVTLPPALEPIANSYPYRAFAKPQTLTAENLRRLLRMHTDTSGSVEFPGFPNRETMAEFLRIMSESWREIAEAHIEQIVTVTHEFVNQLVFHIVDLSTDDSALEIILYGYVDHFFKQKRRALKAKLKELLHPHRATLALPSFSDYTRRLSRRGAERLATCLMTALDLGAFTAESRLHRAQERAASAVGEAQDVPGADFSPDEVMDVMMAYHEMSRRSFIDNVTNLAIESCLVGNLSNILTPEMVHDMTDEELEIVMASDGSYARRLRVDYQACLLRKSLEECQNFAPRLSTGTASRPLLHSSIHSRPSSAGKSAPPPTGPKPDVSTLLLARRPKSK